jgi:hypothetical protein
MFSVFAGAGLIEGDAGYRKGSRHLQHMDGSANSKKTLGMKINQPTLTRTICISI